MNSISFYCLFLDLLVIGQRYLSKRWQWQSFIFFRPQDKNFSRIQHFSFCKIMVHDFCYVYFLAAHALDCRYHYGLRFNWDLLFASPRLAISSRAFASAPEVLSSMDTVRLANCLSSSHATVAEGKENASPQSTHQVSQPDLLGTCYPPWFLNQYNR